MYLGSGPSSKVRLMILSARAAPAGDGRRAGEGDDFLVGDQVVRALDGDLAHAGLLRRGHAQHLALALVEHVVSGTGMPYGLERACVGIAAAAERLPQARILGAEAEQRQPARLHGQGCTDLVVGGCAVQIPDLMLLTAGIVDIREGRIQGGRIEAQRGARRFQQLPGFLDGNLPGPSRARPIVAVRPDANDQLGGIDAIEMTVEQCLVPALARQRTGLAALEMLVIGHQDEAIDQACELGVVVFGFVGRNGNQQSKAVGAKARRKLLDQRVETRLRLQRKLLEVEDQARILAGLEVGVDVVDEGGARLVGGKHFRHPLAVPGSGLRIVVVDERQHLQVRRVGVDPPAHQRFLLRVVALDAAIRALQMQPFDDQHVERAGIALQGGETVVIPVDEMGVPLGGLCRDTRRRARVTGPQERLVHACRRQALLRRDQPRLHRQLRRRKIGAPETGRQQAGRQPDDHSPGSPRYR